MRGYPFGKLSSVALSLLGVCVTVLIMTGCATSRTAYTGDKAIICHKSEKTLLLPDGAVDAHRGHGDTYGPCDAYRIPQ